MLVGCGIHVWTVGISSTSLSTGLTTTLVDSLTVPSDAGRVRFVASASGFYFVVATAAPDVLHVFERRNNTGKTKQMQLPADARSLITVNRKVYALCGRWVVAVDPLRDEMEHFELAEAGGEMCDASDGACCFVVTSVDGLRIMRLGPDTGCEYPTLPLPPTAGPYHCLGTRNRTAIVFNDATKLVLHVARGSCIRAADSSKGSLLSPFVVTNQSKKMTVSLSAGTFRLLLVDGIVLPWPFGVEPEADEPVVLSSSTDDGNDTSDQFTLPACPVCLDDLECADNTAVTLDCGHQMHADCLQECLKGAESYLESAEHISFARAKCPAGCGTLVRHATINPRWPVILKRQKEVEEESILALKTLGDPTKSIDDILCYVCHRCSRPFFGGIKQCPRMVSGEPKKVPTDLVCDTCATDCALHGRKFALFKCRWCCSPATHLCFGSYRVCDLCDEAWAAAGGGLPACKACPGPGLCPLGGRHDDGGSCAIGCAGCISATSDGSTHQRLP